MAYYVRKFARAKWSLLERETEDILEAKYPVITGFFNQSVGIMQK